MLLVPVGATTEGKELSSLRMLGLEVVGVKVGSRDGLTVGVRVGTCDGMTEGNTVGNVDGRMDSVGDKDKLGRDEGYLDGLRLGACETVG
jgi:hypothetical protein